MAGNYRESLAMFEAALGVRPERIFGKPHPDMVTHVLKRQGIPASEALMIGDRLYTDMELARRLPCDFILVLSGETTQADVNGLDHPPEWVADDLSTELD